MLGFLIRRGRQLQKRRRSAALRLTFAVICVGFFAVLTGDWRQELTSEAGRFAQEFPMIVVFPLGVDSADIAFTARQFGALYYVLGTQVIPSSEAWAEMSSQAIGLNGISTSNPLPDIVRITLHPENIQQRIVEEAAVEIKRIAPNCEVKFDLHRADLTSAELAELQKNKIIGTLFVAVVLVILLYFSLRAEHLCDDAEWRALASMGAGRFFIAFPHVIFAVISAFYGIVVVILLRIALRLLPLERMLYPVASLPSDIAYLAVIMGVFIVFSIGAAVGRKR